MKNLSKTFRLFISSTFSDFKKEREILQIEVFPKIKNYCLDKGYIFQPIDLRWGINHEAQLDQKTLEICLDEVKSCKLYNYPNFLIMIGDKYGWIPLPRIIEQYEFENILKFITDNEKNLLLEWYKKDENQLPISYILQERKNEYIDYNQWLIVENNIKNIFQITISNTCFDNDIKDKYFTSATQAEAMEGIISYNRTTVYQQQLLKLIPNLAKVDNKHIFGFFRDIELSSKIGTTFISDDFSKAQVFKKQVKDTLNKENILNITTKQIDNNILDTFYLEQFISVVTKFLIAQVDEQILNDSKYNYTNLEFELKKQNNYFHTKLENFLGQETILNNIQNYINSEDNKPLIICGKSGIGKSSVLAKAIENTSNHTNKKIIFRFVGATPNSTTTKDILTSILEELDLSLNKEILENEKTNQFLTDFDKEENSFMRFSKNIYDKIMDIKDNIVIFIDAVDQLTNDDQFLWIPNKLPLNIKIIISALNDRNYKEDSKYFHFLNDKTSNILEVNSFDKPMKLLTLLLKNQNRSLQENQKEYFLFQYEKIKTPFYVYIVSQEVQYWKSDDIVGKKIFLEGTQKKIVDNFIENLSVKYHHNKKLVEKVLGYIIASNDGLSESELLELLSTDEQFIQEVAPDTWHTNITRELPIVIWTRLYTQLKSFLSIKNQNGQKLLYFFHREFIDAIKSKSNQLKEHECIIEATQKLILKYQDKEFDSNRWGKLYSVLLGEYYFQYADEDKIKKYCKFITKINDNNLLNLYIDNIQQIGYIYNINNKLKKALLYRKILYLMLSNLNEVNKNGKWLFLFIQISHNLASTNYRLNYIDKAIELEEYNIDIINNTTEKMQINSIKYQQHINSDFNKFNNENDLNGFASLIWSDSYLRILSVLSSCYSKKEEFNKAIEFDKQSCVICELFYNTPSEDSKLYFTKHYLVALGNFADSLYKNLEYNRAIKYQRKALYIVEKEFNLTNGYLVEDYARILNNLSVFLAESDINESNKLAKKCQEIMLRLSQQNYDRFFKEQNIISNNHINNFHKEITSLSKKNDLENETHQFENKIKYFDYIYKSFLLLGVYFIIKYVLIE